MADWFQHHLNAEAIDRLTISPIVGVLYGAATLAEVTSPQWLQNPRHKLLVQQLAQVLHDALVATVKKNYKKRKEPEPTPPQRRQKYEEETASAKLPFNKKLSRKRIEWTTDNKRLLVEAVHIVCADPTVHGHGVVEMFTHVKRLHPKVFHHMPTSLYNKLCDLATEKFDGAGAAKNLMLTKIARTIPFPPPPEEKEEEEEEEKKPAAAICGSDDVETDNDDDDNDDHHPQQQQQQPPPAKRIARFLLPLSDPNIPSDDELDTM